MRSLLPATALAASVLVAMLGNPGLLVRNGERRGQDERTHGQEEHRQEGAGDEVTTSNQLYHGRMSTRHA